MLGLDSAGKTTVLYNIKTGSELSTVPTVGFNVETIKYKSILLNLWDVGGQDKIRPLWRHYYTGSQVRYFLIKDYVGAGNCSGYISTSRTNSNGTCMVGN